MDEPRIVTLLPGATELVYALGIEPVGVSHSCDYPPHVSDLPSITTTSIDSDASAAEIDQQVQDASGAVYDVDRSTLQSLDPDLIVTQATCEVCAVDASEVFTAVEALDLETEVVTLDPHSLADVFEALRRLGEVTGRDAVAEAIVTRLRGRIDRIRDRVPPRSDHRVTVLDWTVPPMVAGHWVHEMIDWAGGTYGPTVPGNPSIPTEWAEIRSFDPEILIVSPCGFELDRAVTAVGDLATRTGWENVTAVRENRVYAVDGSGYVNRPGPRLVDAFEALASCIHPDVHDDVDQEIVRQVERPQFVT